MAEYDSTARLELEAVLGFSGQVPGGLQAHPDGRHLIYPLGACIVIKEIGNPSATSDFLYGHNDKISCLAVSPTGRYIASGQVTHPGFQADVCIFDFAERRLVHRMLLHKVKVQTLAFSPDETFLASVGGPDDNTVVVWEVETGRPLCGAPTRQTEASCVVFCNRDSAKLLTGGAGTLRVWTVDVAQRKLSSIDVNMGNLRRTITTIAVEATDKYVYCGTTSGDVVCAQLEQANVFKMQGPQQKLSGGITATLLTQTGDVLVGSGAGEVQLLSKINLTQQRSVSVSGGVSGLAMLGNHFFVGTESSNMYFINGGSFRAELRLTCHSGAVNQVVFPAGFSALFATCSGSDIRVWNAKTCGELLRIEIPDRTCNCIDFTKDGSLIVSGWSDGRIRAFGPQSGKLVFSVNDAHKAEAASGRRTKAGGRVGVTALCTDHAGHHLVSGGSDGQVRLWNVGGATCSLATSMKEHSGTVNQIVMSNDDTECVSASDDGSCIAWDLTRGVRRNVMYSQTYFRGLAYYVDESQVITCASDKSITYWDSVDCNAIRELAGSKTGELNAISMSPDGAFFATGGNDRILKVWDYERGDCVAVGLAHSTGITQVKVSPDGQRIVSAGDDGAVMIWRVGQLDVQGI